MCPEVNLKKKIHGIDEPVCLPYHQKSIIYFQKQQSPYQVNLAVCSTLTYHCTPLLKIIFNCRIFLVKMGRKNRAH